MTTPVLPNRLMIIFALLLPLTLLQAQEKMKFGKIDPADLKMTVCPFDSSADAMVLGDFGQTYFTYDDQEGFMLVFEHHIRIKIFTKSGYHKADFEIPYFHIEHDREDIVNLKAVTYNLENGKITETSVKSESIFNEAVDAYWENKKISFPGVKEGSVVEIKYRIKSPFLANLRDWYFQGDIPVRWSEYEVSIPEFFHYTRQASGFVNFTINENSTNSRHLTQLVINRKLNYGTIVTHYTSDASIDYMEYITRLASKDIPAFKEEPYTNSLINYVSKIEFVYSGYQYPQQPLHPVNSTWEEIVTSLLEDTDFGHQINRGSLVNDIVDNISAQATTPYDKMVLACEYIKTNMKWNDHNSKYPTFNLRKAFQLKTGNCADLNLSLVLLLRELGIKADPVILSTRKNGIAFKPQPSISQMNYVIACANIDGKDYLLDATNRNIPVNMLPFQCLNGEGLVVSKGAARWVPLLQEEKNTALYYAVMKILPDGAIKGKLELSQGGYKGATARNEFAREGTLNYRKALIKDLSAWEVDSVSWKNMDNNKESVGTSYLLESDEVAQSGDNMIYLNVLVNMGQNINPFPHEKRNYPVDFGCPERINYVFSYEIPEGYMVESIPEPLNIALPDQGGTFKFYATKEGNKISVSSKFSLNSVFFAQPVYEILREFYHQIALKHAQQIVLKKV